MPDTVEIKASAHGTAYVIVQERDAFAIDAAPQFGLREYRRSTCYVRGAIVCYAAAPRDARAFAEHVE